MRHRRGSDLGGSDIPVVHRYPNRGQDTDDRDYNQQLDERKAFLILHAVLTSSSQLGQDPASLEIYPQL